MTCSVSGMKRKNRTRWDCRKVDKWKSSNQIWRLLSVDVWRFSLQIDQIYPNFSCYLITEPYVGFFGWKKMLPKPANWHDDVLAIFRIKTFLQLIQAVFPLEPVRPFATLFSNAWGTLIHLNIPVSSSVVYEKPHDATSDSHWQSKEGTIEKILYRIEKASTNHRDKHNYMVARCFK